MWIHFSVPQKSNTQGQATTEYVLILSIAVLLSVLVVRKLILPYATILAEHLSASVEKKIFSPKSMHSVRIKR